jgi:Tol biopolymer transport system component
MEQLDDYRLRLVLFGVVVAIVLGGGRTNADFTFGEPTNLGPTVNSSANDAPGSMSADGLSLYFHSRRPGGHGENDLYVSTRSTTQDVWSEPINLGPTINSPHFENGVRVSSDHLELYFSSDRPGGYGSADLYVSTRETLDDEWGPPVNLGETVNTNAEDRFPSITANGLELYFSSRRVGGYGYDDVWVTKRATIKDPWGEPVHLESGINTYADDRFPSISADGLVLFFYSFHRPGGSGDSDLCMITRASIHDDWNTLFVFGPDINTSSSDWGPAISADGRTLLFSSNRPGGLGGQDLWQLPLLPIVDFNGDGIVDSADIVIMVDHWGTDEPLCDIGPMPWGDGVVDVQDLIFLAEHLFEEVPVRPGR